MSVPVAAPVLVQAAVQVRASAADMEAADTAASRMAPTGTAGMADRVDMAGRVGTPNRFLRPGPTDRADSAGRAVLGDKAVVVTYASLRRCEIAVTRM